MAKKKFYSQSTLPNLTDVTSFPSPSMVGPYRIESRLTKGGMSFLYLATHPKSGEPVVVKILSPKFITNNEMVSRFLKEAEIISMTDHPNIVKLYDQGKWEKGLFIAMEFIQGVSLRQFILQKSLSQKKALQIIQEVAYALLHLHTHGVIHRDLKPENILITEYGGVKVIDFGIAQLHTEIPDSSNKQKGKFIGTPVYMSPEQKKNPDLASFVSDIYSLGIIAYELILGRLSHGVIHFSFLPNELRSIIEKALQPDPKMRYQDIVDFITDINTYLKKIESEKIKEPYGDAFEDFLKKSDIFFHVKPPRWTQLKIGFEKQKGLSSTGLYLDFFKIFDSNYLIIFVEPASEGPNTFVEIATLKGIVHSLVNQLTKKEEESFNLAEFFNALNTIVINAFGDSGLFDCSIVLLNPNSDRLNLISCGSNSLFHYSKNTKKLNELKSTNESLGKDINTYFLETNDSWNIEDIIFMSSKQLSANKNLPTFINSHLLLDPQRQAEKILSDVKSTETETNFQNFAHLSVLRIF